MKIAFDHQIFTQQSYGGVSRYFSQLANELALQEEVKIFASIHRNQYIENLPKKIINGINIDAIPNNFPNVLSHLNRFINYIPIRLWQPNLIHETYYSSQPSGPKNCLRVITVFDMIHELLPEHFSKSDQTRKIKKTAIERADRIICISHSTKQDLIRLLNISEHKIFVTHLGYGEFNSKQEPLKVWQPQRPYLLYVGGRNGYKNFNAFISAFASSHTLKKDFDIVVFGGGSFSNNEAELLRKNKLNSANVMQLNGNDELLCDVYLHARAFVYPSLYEGFGLPPLEAMHHRCPVISSNSSSMPEVIGDAGAYFSPLDQEDIKNTLEKTLYDDDFLQDLIEKGVMRAKMFTWQKCARETLEIYRKER